MFYSKQSNYINRIFQTMSATAEDKGGMVTGPSHAKGGVKFIVDGRLLEAEGGEPVLPGEIMQDNNQYEFTGTHLEILDQINEKFGARSMDEKAKIIDAGDVIICKISARDDRKHTYKGTLTEIVSAINQSGGCNPIGNNMEHSCECHKNTMEGGGVAQQVLAKTGKFVADRWADLPETYRLVKKVGELAFQSTPYDKNLLKILDEFVGTDELRPVLTAINFSESGITATDAHKLIFIPAKTEYRGMYATTPSALKVRKQIQVTTSDSTDYKGDQVLGKYPNYKAVFPEESPSVFTVDVLKLKTYCDAVRKADLASKVTNMIQTKYGTNEDGSPSIICFNLKFLSGACEAWMQMGHRKVFFGMSAPNRAIVMSAHEPAAQSPQSHVDKKHAMMIVMPVMAQTDKGGMEFLGSAEIDYERYGNFYYDFTTDDIRNQDGSAAEFNENLTVASDTVVNDEQYDLLRAVIKKAGVNTLPMLEYVTVNHGIAHATSLDCEVLIHGLKAPDGAYLPKNGDLLIDPSADVGNMVAPMRERDGEVKREIGKFSRSELLFHLQIAAKCVGKDELRPVLSGIHIFNSDGHILIEATNAQIAYRNELINADFEPRKKILFGNADILVRALKMSDHEVVDVIATDSVVFFNIRNITVGIRQIDGVYPRVDAVFPKKFPHSITIDAEKLRNCLAKVSKTERKEFQANVGLTKIEHQVKVEVLKSEKHVYGNQKRELKERRELCLLDSKPGEVGDFENYGLLVMPTIEEPEELFIAFQTELMEHVLGLIPDHILTIEYSERNRSTRFSGEHSKNYWHPDNLGHHIEKMKRSAIVKPKQATATQNAEMVDRTNFAKRENKILKALLKSK